MNIEYEKSAYFENLFQQKYLKRKYISSLVYEQDYTLEWKKTNDVFGSRKTTRECE
jgi:hypothetical protein